MNSTLNSCCPVTLTSLVAPVLIGFSLIKGEITMNENQLTRRKNDRMKYRNEDCPCRQLWKRVLCQMIDDATLPCKKKEAIKIRREATEWLLKDNRDFPIVCEHAGFDPDIVRENVRKMVKNYFPQGVEV